MSTETKKIKPKIKPKAAARLPDNTAFFEHKSLDDLIKEQGRRPFNVEEAGKNWPEDADFEEFLAAIHSGRKHTADDSCPE